MAKYRLKTAHYIEGDKWLPGDLENAYKGEEQGTIVGDGTPHPISSPTLEMVPLDDEAHKGIALEEERLTRNQASMSPVEQLAMHMGVMSMDTFEQRYVPGFNVQRDKLKGAPK